MISLSHICVSWLLTQFSLSSKLFFMLRKSYIHTFSLRSKTKLFNLCSQMSMFVFSDYV